MSSTIQWCYPKHWKSLCHFDPCLSKFCSYGTTIFNILDNTTELWMTKYIIGEIFSSGRATLYKNPSDQTLYDKNLREKEENWVQITFNPFFGYLQTQLSGTWPITIPLWQETKLMNVSFALSFWWWIFLICIWNFSLFFKGS